MEALSHMSGFDVQLLGYCDFVVLELCKLLNWDLMDKENINLDKPSFIQGSLPHRFLFEGGTESIALNYSDNESDLEQLEESSQGDDSDITTDEEDTEGHSLQAVELPIIDESNLSEHSPQDNAPNPPIADESKKCQEDHLIAGNGSIESQ